MLEIRPTFTAYPVAIGGLGGSGTRVLAALLQAAGVYIGPCLNTALDNLWFTFLFKRQEWARRPHTVIPSDSDISGSVHLFHRAMVHGLAGWNDQEDQALLSRLRSCLPPEGKWVCGASAEHAESLRTSQPPDQTTTRSWGWKEPNTHIFLPQLNRHIPGLRYIHLVRDGLDMAFSENTWQARHWSHLFGMPYHPERPLPPHQLRYWSVANESALRYGRDHMPGRFLTVQYEDLCKYPSAHWIRIQRFLGVSDLMPLPPGLINPSSIGRSITRDMSVFSQADLDQAYAVRHMVAAHGTVAQRHVA